MITNKKLLLGGILAAVISFGCASFPGRELPTYTYNQITAPEKKISVSFDVKAFDVFGENSKFESNLIKIVQNSLTKSLSFDQVGTNVSDGEYHYTFYFRGEPNDPGLTNVNAIFSGFTFLILPVYDRYNYSLTVDVKQGASLIKTYTYRDHINIWYEILLLAIQPFYWPPDVANSVIENMVMNFVHDFNNDIMSTALFQKGQDFKLPAQPDNNTALLYVVHPTHAVRMGVTVFLDNKKNWRGYLTASEYIYFTVTPGKHQIYTKRFLNDWDEITVEPKGGDVLFIRQDIKYLNGQKNNRASLSIIDTEEGIYQIRNSRLVD